MNFCFTDVCMPVIACLFKVAFCGFGSCHFLAKKPAQTCGDTMSQSRGHSAFRGVDVEGAGLQEGIQCDCV